MSGGFLDRYERDERRGVAAEIAWYAVLTVLASALLVAGVSATAAIVPGYCALCHGTFASGLEEQAHAGINCDRCHGATDVFGLIDKRLTGVSMIASKLVPGIQVVTSATDDDLCLACHAEDIRGVIESQGLRMSHREVTQVRMGCGLCHSPSAHPKEQTYVIGYSMDKCMQCHESNPQNPDTCTMCHVGAAPDERQARTSTSWRLVHGASWRQTHGLGDVRGCSACHKEGSCARCHKIDLPHPPTFPGDHGEIVVERESGLKDCLSCHDLKACDQCHGIAMPHPASFQKEHKKTVETRGISVCWRCHPEDACEACHDGHEHPEFDIEKPQMHKAKPARTP